MKKVKIISKKIIKKKIKVYDIEVDDHKHYILDTGVISHNSFIPIDVIAGGSGVEFSCDIIQAITRAKIKTGDIYTGVRLTLKNYKNRHAREEVKIKLYLDYDSGIDKYSGLFEFCVDNGYFKEAKNNIKKYADAFEEFKDKLNNKEKLYTHDEILFFTESQIKNTPNEIFTEDMLKDINETIIKPYFNYGKEYTKE